MDTPQPSNSLYAGRVTGFVLGLVVFLCMTLIGAAGYVKYQLDRAEGVMAAPGSAFVSDQEAFEKLRRTLGYSGFVGFAQTYVTSHEASVLADMRAQEKLAEYMISHLPEKTPGEVRHDLQAILTAFKNALQKAEKSTGDPAGFTASDMAPLYAALPILDSRLESAAAANRLEAQGRLQLWSMVLLLTCWCSLIIACGLAAGTYLTLRGRNSAPLRALAQSIKNMARGDMRTAIWGMERQDTVGDLARAIDLARYQFSQLPDMSLLSEQGPVRLRFEGNTRSLFEAMMQVISRDSEQVRSQANALTTAIGKQQEAITLISSRVEAVLHNVEKRGMDGDQQVRQVLQNIIGSAQSLKHAQEHAADQLNRILPYLQERAHGMAEITQITGKQVAQILASLTLSERGLRASAEQSESAIKKLSSSADTLGERMFGAVNLLQASGKVLAETTEKTQSRLNEAINLINSGGVPMTASAPDTSPRFEAVASALEATQKKLEERLGELALPEGGTTEQTPVFADNLMVEIRAGFESMNRRIEQIQAQQFERPVEQPKQPKPLHEIEMVSEESTSDRDLVIEIKTGFETMNRQIGQVREQIAAMTLTASATPSGPDQQLRDQWYQMAGQIEATRTAIEQTITKQMERIEERLASFGGGQQVDPAAFSASQQQMEQQTQILSELVATLGVLDAHMQQLKSEIGQNKQNAQISRG